MAFSAPKSIFNVTPDIIWQGWECRIYTITGGRGFSIYSRTKLMELVIKFWIWFFYTLYRIVMHFTYLIPRMVLGAITAIFKKPW